MPDIKYTHTTLSNPQEARIFLGYIQMRDMMDHTVRPSQLSDVAETVGLTFRQVKATRKKTRVLQS